MVLIPIVIDRDFNNHVGIHTTSRLCRIMSKGNGNHPAQMAFRLEKTDDATLYYLCDEIGDWLLERGVQSHKCKLHWVGGPNYSSTDQGDWILSVPDHLALLFKLTWGGV